MPHAYDWAKVPAPCRALFVERVPADEKRHFMAHAIAVSRRSPFRPTVGAVIVRDGAVIAEGFRDSIMVPAADGGTRTRSLHAEEMALRAAPDDLSGAVLYTTLEPCFDRASPRFGEAIEACSSALARRGIEAVVIGLIDHEPRNLGTGAAYLAERGVRLEHAYVGLEAELLDLIGDGRFWHAPPGYLRWRTKLRRRLRSLRRRLAGGA